MITEIQNSGSIVANSLHDNILGIFSQFTTTELTVLWIQIIGSILIVVLYYKITRD